MIHYIFEHYQNDQHYKENNNQKNFSLNNLGLNYKSKYLFSNDHS